ncbi:MAG: Gfo/Idh/MocA family oxidoreductase [Solobacterium sp.]|nr:Gfo/Idh/MocA family oxidoreductase [Solobacterium sp.]
MNSSVIRYGILSTASVVPRFVNAMRQTGTGEVLSIASRSIDKAKAAAEEVGIPNSYDDIGAILSDPHIDAVYIPLINRLHYPYMKQALLAGKHVLCEKPFVLHAEEAEELAALAEERKLFLTETVKTPFLPVFQRIKEIIDSGRYGRIRYMDFRQSYTGGSYIGGWNVRKEDGGGVLFGNQAYFFTMAEFLAGDIVSCSGTLSFSDGDADDQAAVTALTETDAVAVLHVSRRVLFDNGLIIYLDGGRIVIPDYWKADKAYIYAEDKQEETLSYPCRYEFVYELSHYNDCIQKGLSFSPVTPVSAAARHVAFTEAILRANDKQPAAE